MLLVPGNFHLGFHSKNEVLQKALSKNGFFEVDFFHKINYLYFGTEVARKHKDEHTSDFKLRKLRTLDSFTSKEIEDSTGPYSFKYSLVILPTNLIYEDGREYEIYQYKTFWNVAYIERNFNYLISFE